MYCDICSQERLKIIKNYKNTGWNVCDLPECIEIADKENLTMDNRDMEDLDGMEKSIQKTDDLLNEILTRNLEFDEIIRAINKNSKVSYALGCRFDGVMRVENGQSLLMYTDMQTTRTTFTVLADQDFEEQLTEVCKRFCVAPVKIGQGDNTKEWTPELIKGKQGLIKSTVAMIARKFRKQDND